MIGDAPIIDLLSEWLDLRLYLILNCSKFTMKDVLNLLAKQDTSISSIYPNFSKLSQFFFFTFPNSIIDCERAFSTMKRIKTRLRSQMTNVTLNHCRVSMEGLPLIEFNFDKCVDSWSRLKNRRIGI